MAHWIFDTMGQGSPAILDEEGRVMVLRGLLTRQREKLKLFRASARLSGFAQQLSEVLREIQDNQFSPATLRQMAARAGAATGLAAKLEDLALLLEEYLRWLDTHRLRDSGLLLDAAAELIRRADEGLFKDRAPSLWVDGFAELSHQELNLIQAVAARCRCVTITFCLEDAGENQASWLSSWSLTQETFKRCRKRLSHLPGADICTQVLSREPGSTRFEANPWLKHIEQFWTEPRPCAAVDPEVSQAVGMALCTDAETEAIAAAREVMRHVRSGGRYRDVGVLIRSLDDHHETLRRVFTRYEIPFFLDRRESVAHHPLAELTRSALRTIAFDWPREDWFAGLKTGLVPVPEPDVDRLENEAIARGWKGDVWSRPLLVNDSPELTEWLAQMQAQIVPPFAGLARALTAAGSRPDGPQLAAALRALWQALKVEETLATWASTERPSGERQVAGSVHLTVWEQMNAWLNNVELAFAGDSLSLREWLPVLEAGLANLSVGVIPPALDQVIISALNRSRNLEVDLAIVLGVNEGVFPARPVQPVLLSEADRTELEQMECGLGRTVRGHLARERHLAYLAFTRARRRLLVTAALQGSDGSVLNPSPFFTRIGQLFPNLPVAQFSKETDLEDILQRSELIVPLLRHVFSENSEQGAVIAQTIKTLQEFSPLSQVLENVRKLREPVNDAPLSAALARRLYGSVIRTSVSRMEQFAACPFKFFIYAGLRAEERERFELDIREQGSFQHDVLAAFHDELREAGLRWRDVTSASARDRVGRISERLSTTYRDGLLQVDEQTRFMTRVMTQSLQDFIETLVHWMREQYQFDPVAVELPFGTEPGKSAWSIGLAGDQHLELIGRIDRVDLCRVGSSDEALCVVVDYKSSGKQLDPLLVAHGVQLQLLAYLNVLRHWPSAADQ
ncbi:MAG TPA: PD-(D/E)XK nuclease family protein, partial [Clostridia bacterium]|nr:PD-(D/E)XK nuclease family protein [Clostridia bacterium]